MVYTLVLETNAPGECERSIRSYGNNKEEHMNMISLDYCKKCSFFKGMSSTLVICNHLIKYNAMILSMPSNSNKDFDSGIMIVRCPK